MPFSNPSKRYQVQGVILHMKEKGVKLHVPKEEPFDHPVVSNLDLTTYGNYVVRISQGKTKIRVRVKSAQLLEGGPQIGDRVCWFELE